jgi:hypothetical protein
MKSVPHRGDPEGGGPHWCNLPSFGRHVGWKLLKAGEVVPGRVSRSFAAKGVVRMTVYGPIHLGWRGFGCSCLKRTLSPGDRGPWSGRTVSDWGR